MCLTPLGVRHVHTNQLKHKNSDQITLAYKIHMATGRPIKSLTQFSMFYTVIFDNIYI